VGKQIIKALPEVHEFFLIQKLGNTKTCFGSLFETVCSVSYNYPPSPSPSTPRFCYQSYWQLLCDDARTCFLIYGHGLAARILTTSLHVHLSAAVFRVPHFPELKWASSFFVVVFVVLC
jgi:hypothetical protein